MSSKLFVTLIALCSGIGFVSASLQDLEFLLQLEDDDEISKEKLRAEVIQERTKNDGGDGAKSIPRFHRNNSKWRRRRSLDLDTHPSKFESSRSEEARLVKHLFTSYDKHIRPVVNASEAVQGTP